MEEKHKTVYIEQGKKKTQIGLMGGGGAGSVFGIVLWGGALVVAGFVAAYAFKKRGRRGDKEKSSSPRKEDQASIRGLKFILQNSSPSSHSKCCTSNGSNAEMATTQIDSCVLNSTKSLNLDESIPSAVDCRIGDGSEETLFVSDSDEDDVTTGIEEVSLPVLQVGNRINNELKELPLTEIMEVKKEELPLMETIQGQKEEKAVDAVKKSVEKAALVLVTGGEEDDEKLVKVGLPSGESTGVDKDDEGETSSVQLMEEGEEGGDKEMAIELLSAESIGVWEEEEAIHCDSKKGMDLALLICSVEEGEDNGETIEKLMKRIIMRNEEEEENGGAADTSADLSLPISPIGEGGVDETVEESPLTERIEVWMEEALIGALKSKALASSIQNVGDGDEGDNNPGKELLSMKELESWKEEAASIVSLDMASSMQKPEEAEDSDSKADDQDEKENEEHAMEEDENSDKTWSDSAGSDADGMQPEESTETLPMKLKHNQEYPASKIVDEGQTTKAEEYNGHIEGKINNLSSCRHDYQNTQTPMFLKKEETLKHMLVKMVLTKWGVWTGYILLLAFMVLLLLTRCSSS